MYTQCPDCSVAFRVTADVLRQAAGKVRCGGCGSAFNALDHLSESMPEQPQVKDAEEALPELTPEPPKDDSGLPASISAEQSAALLKTLDELAGSDIRIEDTGVEWRVLDDDEVGDAADDDIAVDVAVEDQPQLDEILEDSPTPVDQFLTDTPPQVDAPEIFEEKAAESDVTRFDELRFDDNTPLPDDFDLDNEASYARLPDPEPVTKEPVIAVDENPQADLDLSEPEEWTDILGEFEELAESVSAKSNEPTIADELEALKSLDDDTDEAISEDEPVAVASEDDATGADEPASESAADSGNEPLDMDSQFALQAEAMGIDLSGMHQAIEAEEEALDEKTLEDDDLDALLDDSRIVDRDIDDLLEEELVDDATVGDLDFEEFEEDTSEDEPPDAASDEEEDLPDDSDDDEDFDIDELGLEIDIAAAELENDDEAEEDDSDDEFVDDDYSLDEEVELVVPPLSEEEQTINMMIDQDLLAIAVEDKDGFASTMVLPGDSAEDKASEEQKELDAGEKAEVLKDTSAGFETIIMEGESIKNAFDQDKLAVDAAAAASLAGAAAAEREAEKASRGGNRRYGMIAGVVVLVLLLAVQYVHQSREMLATIPAFNNVVGPMYRALGQPLSPEWDITGWRFEATKGSTDENDEKLTIYSRLGNKSDKPLPYPLIGISLTDRFEETVGSRVLDPAEYLSNDLDPRKLVQPGNTFNAVISIQSPSEEATGFKLNVCYRESGGDLRCAIDDFK